MRTPLLLALVACTAPAMGQTLTSGPVPVVPAGTGQTRTLADVARQGHPPPQQGEPTSFFTIRTMKIPQHDGGLSETRNTVTRWHR